MNYQEENDALKEKVFLKKLLYFFFIDLFLF
jgi:hypothetical protein